MITYMWPGKHVNYVILNLVGHIYVAREACKLCNIEPSGSYI